MSDVVNRLAVRFEEQYREDHRGLRGELAGLRHILSAIVLQQGEEYRLYDRARLLASPDDGLEFTIDTNNRCLVIRRESCHRTVEPVVQRVDERLPDWML